MSQTKKTILLLIIIFLTVPSAEALNKRQKLLKVKEELIYQIDCSKLNGLKYYQGFPAEITQSRSGKVTSQEYKSKFFHAISFKKHEDGHKRYFMPAIYEGMVEDPPADDDGNILYSDPATFKREHVGFISYKVHRVHEIYDPEKHGPWQGDQNTEERTYTHIANKYARMRGSDPVLAEKYIETSYDEVAQRIVRRKWVTYETCYDPQVHNRSGDIADFIASIHVTLPTFAPFCTIPGHEGFPGEGILDSHGGTVRDKFAYGEDDAPTYLGYSTFYGDMLNNTIKELNTMDFGVRIVAALTPGVSPALTALECRQSGDPYCWAEAAAEASLDLTLLGGFLVRLGNGAAKLKKAAEVGSKLQGLERKAEYFAAGVDVVGGVHDLANGNVSGIFRFVAVSGDLVTLRMAGGKVEVKDWGPQDVAVNCRKDGKPDADILAVDSRTHEPPICPKGDCQQVCGYEGRKDLQDGLQNGYRIKGIEGFKKGPGGIEICAPDDLCVDISEYAESYQELIRRSIDEDWSEDRFNFALVLNAIVEGDIPVKGLNNYQRKMLAEFKRVKGRITPSTMSMSDKYGSVVVDQCTTTREVLKQFFHEMNHAVVTKPQRVGTAAQFLDEVAAHIASGSNIKDALMDTRRLYHGLDWNYLGVSSKYDPLYRYFENPDEMYTQLQSALKREISDNPSYNHIIRPALNGREPEFKITW